MKEINTRYIQESSTSDFPPQAAISFAHLLICIRILLGNMIRIIHVAIQQIQDFQEFILLGRIFYIHRYRSFFLILKNDSGTYKESNTNVSIGSSYRDFISVIKMWKKKDGRK